MPASGSLLKKAILLVGILSLLLICLTTWAFFQVPSDAKIPIHWNAKGEVDGWSGRGGFWFIPGTLIFNLLLFAVVPFFEPRMGKKLLASKAYGTVIFFSTLVLICAQVGIIVSAFGRDFPMLPVIFTATGMLFLVIGNYLPKIRSNFAMGVRTPWTLSSELSWNKTHRLAGKLFALFGLAILVVAWIPGADRWIVWFLLGGLGLLVGVTSVYSWRVWKDDPVRSR